MPDRPPPLPTYPAGGTLADLLEYARSLRARAAEMVSEAAEIEVAVGRLTNVRTRIPTSLVYPGDELPPKPGEPDIVAPGFPGDHSRTALRPAFPGPLHGAPPSALSSLTSDADSTILRGVIANSSGKLARGISRSRSKKHPFVRALYEHPDPKRRMTVTDWAKKNGYKPGTVATWVKNPKADGARRIPRDAVEKIRLQFGLGDEAWAVGITEPE